MRNHQPSACQALCNRYANCSHFSATGESCRFCPWHQRWPAISAVAISAWVPWHGSSTASARDVGYWWVTSCRDGGRGPIRNAVGEQLQELLVKLLNPWIPWIQKPLLELDGNFRNLQLFRRLRILELRRQHLRVVHVLHPCPRCCHLDK